jgi:hypothetical protein
MKPLRFAAILLIGWFGYSVASLSANEFTLNKLETISLNIPPDTSVILPTGAVARAKLFSFALQSLTIEADLGEQTETFTLTDIPAFEHPKAVSYDAQETIPPQFQIALRLQATKGAIYHLVGATYLLRYALKLSFSDELDSLISLPDGLSLEETVELNTAPVEALAPEMFLCIGFNIDRMQVDVQIQQDAENLVDVSFPQSPVVSSEFIVNDIKALNFTTQNNAPVEMRVDFRVNGTINLSLSDVCLTRSDYPTPTQDVRLGEPPQAPPGRRGFFQNRLLEPVRFQVLSVWPADIQWNNQDGVIPGENAAEISTERLSHQDEVYPRITFTAGPRQDQTVELKFRSVSSPNRPPAISSVKITADSARPITVSTLILQPDGTDEDGDALNYRYHWLKQNVLIQNANGDTLDGSFFQRGDVISALVVPDDSTTEGVPVKPIEPIIIQNARPQFEAVELLATPAPPREESILEAIPSGWLDHDGDREQYEYTWFVNGNPLEATISSAHEVTERIADTQRIQINSPFNIPVAFPVLEGTLGGKVKFISPSGTEIEEQLLFEEPSIPVDFAEIGEYTIEETFEFIISSSNPFLRFERRIPIKTFRWTYANPAPAERSYNYTVRLRDLILDISGQIDAHLELPNPGREFSVGLEVENLPAGKIEVALTYQADFTKRSTIGDATLTGADFNAGDEVHVVVLAHDGFDQGNHIKSQGSRIQNTPPSIGEVQIRAEPSPAKKDSLLTATVSGWYDSDNDPEQIRYQWYNQNGFIGGETGATLARKFLPGDKVYVEATPSDGKEQGQPQKSQQMTIGPGSYNSPVKAKFTCKPKSESEIKEEDIRKIVVWEPKEGKNRAPFSGPNGEQIFAEAIEVTTFAVTVEFEDTTDNATEWIWELGDGSPRHFGQKVERTYEPPSSLPEDSRILSKREQTQRVRLAAFGPDGCAYVEAKVVIPYQTLLVIFSENEDGCIDHLNPHPHFAPSENEFAPPIKLTPAISEDSAGNLVVEFIIETDNGVVRLPWDVNRDGQVDIFDLVLVGDNFGKIVEYPRPNPKAPNPDVNRDGVVDIFDLTIVAVHFGENDVVVQ